MPDTTPEPFGIRIGSEGPIVTGTSQEAPAPELPFDPDAAKRAQAYLDTLERVLPHEPDVAPVWDDSHEIVRLTRADLHEVLRQRAYARDENVLLAEKCAAWRGQYEDARARLEAVRSVTNEWHTFAVGEGREIDPSQTAVAGHALAQVLRALDGDPEGV
jgi:hypothetical protein